MSTNEEIQKFVSKIVDQDEQNVLKMLEPSYDRKEMGAVYESVLGYDPITYFDRHDVEVALDQALRKFATADGIDVAIRHRDNIVEDVMTNIDADRPDMIGRYVYNAVSGYVDDELIDDITDEDDDTGYYDLGDDEVDNEINSADLWDDDVNSEEEEDDEE